MVEIRRLSSIRPSVRISMPRKPPREKPWYREREWINVRKRVHVLRRLVDHPPPTPQPTPCRLWQGRTDRDGYGLRWVYRADGTRYQTGMHRWVMSQAEGRELEPHEFVMHACDHPLCYRLDHLSIGTLGDNNRDMFAKGRGHAVPPVLLGEFNGRSKLNGWQVRAIRKSAAAGLSQRTLAAEYNVAPQTISKIINGQTWSQPETRYDRKPAGKGGC